MKLVLTKVGNGDPGNIEIRKILILDSRWSLPSTTIGGGNDREVDSYADLAYLNDVLFMIYINQIADYENKNIELKGWVYNFRSSGSIFFLQLRDGTGRVQVVVSKKDVPDTTWNVCMHITIETSVIVRGMVKVEARASGGFELQGTQVQIISVAEEFPIGKKEHGPDFLLDHRHLWLRSSREEAILRIRDEIIFSLRQFFYERGFACVDSPIFTGNACEGTSNLFEVNYFDEKAYLTQSGQLYQEAASAALGKTYCFGPTFRAEKSKTRRHLTEFWMLEAEASFYDFTDNMQLQEEMLVYVLGRVLSCRKNDLLTLERDISKLKSTLLGLFPRIPYVEAIEKLRALGSDIKDGDDLGGDDETILTKNYDRPIFVTKYPSKVKSFYMKPDPENSAYVLCSDMLAPEGYGEIAGGSQRIDDVNQLHEKIAAHNLPESAFAWYIDLRKFGSVPHSGFGLGLERTVAWICGVPHVRECIPFPRTLQRLYP